MSGEPVDGTPRLDDEEALLARVLRVREEARERDARRGEAERRPSTGGPGGDGVPRLLIALAGAPGAGKSTLAERLVARLPAAVLMPMDGFHLDDTLLEPAGLLPVKGSPATFDAAGLLAALERVRRDDAEVLVPVFDRARELSRAAATRIEPAHRIVVVEGNYLLLDRAPWDRLAALFDLSVLIDVDAAVLRERLIRRWRGFGLDPAAALARAEANDLPNGTLVRETSRRPDVLFVPVPDDGPAP